jgi:hypothetical protein
MWIIVFNTLINGILKCLYHFCLCPQVTLQRHIIYKPSVNFQLILQFDCSQSGCKSVIQLIPASLASSSFFCFTLCIVFFLSFYHLFVFICNKGCLALYFKTVAIHVASQLANIYMILFFKNIIHKCSCIIKLEHYKCIVLMQDSIGLFSKI